MGEEDLIRTADIICFGHRIVSVETRDGMQTFMFRPLKLEERNLADRIYEEALEEATQKEMPTKNELRASALQQKLWTPRNDVKIKHLISDIQQLEKDKSQAKHKSKKRRLDKQIARLRGILLTLSELRLSIIDMPSREHYAEQSKLRYMIFKTTLRFPSMSRVWETLEEFERHKDMSMLYNLASFYGDGSDISDTMIRKIARMSYWRMKWLGVNKSQGIETLFGNALSDITLDQYRLLHWTHVYDSVYSAYDRPPEEIIEDDQALDEWFEQRIQEQEQESKKKFAERRIKSKFGGKIDSSSEVGVFVDGFYSDKCTCDKPGGKHANNCPYGVFFYYPRERREKEAQHIHEGNPAAVRRIMQRERRIIDQKGIIDERDLRKRPDGKPDLAARAMFGATTHVKRIGK